MKIKVNDKDISFNKRTVDELIEFLNLNANRIVVEKNATIIPRDRYEEEELEEGDVMEIIRIVGGG